MTKSLTATWPHPHPAVRAQRNGSLPTGTGVKHSNDDAALSDSADNTVYFGNGGAYEVDPRHHPVSEK